MRTKTDFHRQVAGICAKSKNAGATRSPIRRKCKKCYVSTTFPQVSPISVGRYIEINKFAFLFPYCSLIPKNI